MLLSISEKASSISSTASSKVISCSDTPASKRGAGALESHGLRRSLPIARAWSLAARCARPLCFRAEVIKAVSVSFEILFRWIAESRNPTESLWLRLLQTSNRQPLMALILAAQASSWTDQERLIAFQAFSLCKSFWSIINVAAWANPIDSFWLPTNTSHSIEPESWS